MRSGKAFMRFNCSGGWIMARNEGEDTIVTYARPKNATDLKRVGRELCVSIGNVTVRYNGKQLRSIKKVLQAVGEI